MFNESDFFHQIPNLKKSGVNIEFTKEQIRELAKCAKDPIYFCKYIKIEHPDPSRGLIEFKPWDFQKKLIRTIAENRFTIAKFSRQSGKALCVDTPIPTINGWSTMGDLKVGDVVFDMYGKPCRVTFKSEIHIKPTYRVTFSDGTFVDCCEDHLWYVHDYAKSRTEFTEVDTKTIAKTGVKLGKSTYENRYAIPVTKPVEYSPKNLPIDPYLLGVWLGDGTSATGTVTIHEDDLDGIFDNIRENISIKRYNKLNPKVLSVLIEGLNSRLNRVGLKNNKHIPTIYLQSSVEDRINLLQGIMDTDGYVNKNGKGYQLCFSIKYENLIEGCKELLASLGIKYTVYNYTNTSHPSTSLRFTVSLSDLQLFKLPRKLERQGEMQYTKHHKKFITSVDLITTKPTQCITVDSNTHTYLCTKNYIVTHNTTCTVAIILWHVLFNRNYKAGVLANKMEQAQEILRRAKIAYVELPMWMQQGVKVWAARNIEFENGSLVMCAATTSSSIRGKSLSMIYLDEFAHISMRMQSEFYASSYPVISAGEETKIVITSTPYGMDLFYKIWKEAEEGINSFKHVSSHWSDMPGRDEKWKRATIKEIGSEQKFRQEFDCVFDDTIVTVKLPSGKVHKMTILELYNALS